MLNDLEIDEILESMVITVDNREQPCPRYHKRVGQFKHSFERTTLSYGDYSCRYTLPGGLECDFAANVVIERKMNLEELCMCFGTQRKRFIAEFERAKEKGCKIYLLVEKATWKDLIEGHYDSKYNPAALFASIIAWIPRYNMIPILCEWEVSGKIIEQILVRELKEHLKKEDI